MKFYTNVSCVGNHIYYRGIEHGRRVRLKTEYSPTLHLPSTSPPSSNSWSDIHGNPLEPMEFPSIFDAREFIKKYEHVEGFRIYGNPRFEYSYIADRHPEETVEWESDSIVTAYLDIEVGSEYGMPTIEGCSNPITAITVKLSTSPTYTVFGYGDYTPHRPDIEWVRCENEHDLLIRFLLFWKDAAPDIVTGWNIKTFDIPYLIGRLFILPEFGEQKAEWLSPWGKVYAKQETFYGKPQRVYQIVGMATLDYLQLFRKYAPNANQENFKLDHIASVELNEQKLDYSEYETLHNLYMKNYQKFIEYNIRDVELVERLNQKSGLIDMALTLAYDNKTNYEDVFSQVRMWDTICYNYLRRKHIVVPPKQHTEKTMAYEGAYVKEPQCGRHSWVASFDLNSLYPHLIMQYNLSPDMLIEPEEYTLDMISMLNQGVSVHKLLHQTIDLSPLSSCTITPNGQFFNTKRQGFLSEIMQRMYADRVKYKKMQIEAQKEKEVCRDPERIKELDAKISRYKNLQLAKKVGLNSAYGALGNEYFRFYDIRIAEAVTKAGQLSIRWIENKINEFMNKVLKTTNIDYVIASDTDSIYLNLAPLTVMVWTNPLTKTIDAPKAKIIDWMDKLCKDKLQSFIDTSYRDLATYVHAYSQSMQMKRESLVDTAIWVAKKRYILNVWDQEGVRYKTPDLKIQGLEAIKSSTPAACREKIKEALKIIMTGTEDELIAHIDKFKKEFNLLPISDIAFPRSANDLSKYSQAELVAGKGSPIHIRGCLIYNHFLMQFKVQHHYESIKNGDKIKFIYLREPNFFRSHVISFLTRIPKEFDLDRAIDYSTQFQKSFVEPLNIILKSIGWKSEKVSTLEGFWT